MSAATAAAAAASASGPSLPGTTGTSNVRAKARARILSPNRANAAVGGPTNVNPASAQRSAKAAFSARKP